MQKCKSSKTSDHNARVPLNSVGVIDCDHDLGDYADDGGDGIQLLDWFEETNRHYSIRIHTMNPVGRANMERVIEKNGWKKVFGEFLKLSIDFSL